MQVLLEQLEIGSDPTEVARARRWARARLAGSGVDADEPLAETLILLISELVTNAVVHTGCPAVLCMLLPRRCPAGAAHEVAGSVRVEVADASSRAPRRRLAEGEDTGGRGLELVSGLADRWGWEHEPGGKRVWCELDTAPLGAVDPAPANGRESGARREARANGEPRAGVNVGARVNVAGAGAGAFG
ncbi:ATP-binding protein [Streptomyces sp. NPDC006784]|uniref:ATP-binding protein n=1 Tax=Streptomyces sp. NPDC006784 TaxID=3364764 RepID=UPI00369BC16C